MAYKFIKYLDPETKQYRDDVTIRAVGDLDRLETTVKTTIVDAINSLINGAYNPGGGDEIPSNVSEKIDELQNKINNLFKENGMSPEQLVEFGKLISKEVEDDINKKSEEDKLAYKALLDNAVQTYQNKVEEVNLQLDTYNNNIEQATRELSNARNEISQSHEDYTNLKQLVDNINGIVSSKVDYSVFDLMNASLKQGSTDFEQNKEAIKLIAKEKGLDFSDDEVYEAFAQLRVLSGRIDSKVSLQEVNEEIDKVNTSNYNLLRYSRDLSNGWNPSNGHVILGTEKYRNTKVFETTSDTGYYTTTLDNLTIGKTYTASIFAKVKNSNSNIQVKFHYGSKNKIMGATQKDTTVINGWKRVYIDFVAERESETVSFRFANLGNNNVGYFCAPKVDIGLKPKNWQPHIDDDYSELKIQETNITQTSKEIVNLANAITQNGENVISENASIRNAAEAIRLQAEKVSKIDEDIQKRNAEIEINSEAIKQKVWQDDIDTKIGKIDIDTKNRILNSDFKREFSNWRNSSNQFRIVELDGVKYATAKRTGLTADNVIALESDFIPASNGERLMFSFDFIAKSLSALDNKTIFSIELYNSSDHRVFRENYTIEKLNGDVTEDKLARLSGAYVIDRADVAKAKIRLMLTRNGEVFFTRVSVQHGSINNTLWNAAPEDLQLIVSEMETSITQKANEVAINAVSESINPVSEIVKRNEAGISVASNILKAFLVDETGKKQEITASPERLLIDFDKVFVTKEMLVNKLTAISLDVAKGFRVMNGDKVVLGANSDGEVEMNVTSLRINASEVATKEDINNISLTPGPKGDTGERGLQGLQGPQGDRGIQGAKGADGQSSYTHLAYFRATKALTDDPHFDIGMNEIVIYNNSGDGSVTVIREANVIGTSQSVGNNRIKIQHTKLGGSPNRGGFRRTLNYENNKIYYIEFEALIPNGASLNIHTNLMGDGGRVRWLTDNTGINAFKRYAYVTYTGTGAVQTGGHISINHSTAVFDWYVSYYQQYDITDTFSTSNSLGATHIGMYVDNVSADSNDIHRYRWTEFKGQDGSNGLPGAKGEDGRTPYFHTAYANSADGRTDFSTTISDGKRYIGTYTDFEQTDSTDPSRYKWVDMVGSIQVGGRNLINGSETITDWTKYDGGKFTINEEGAITAESGNKTNVLKIYHNMTKTLPTEEEIGKVMTYSVYVENLREHDITVRLNGLGGESKVLKGNTRERMVFTGTRQANLYIQLRIMSHHADYYVRFKAEKQKLEEGNVPTDWSPSPEDIDNKINLVDSKIINPNLLENSSFSENLDGWETSGEFIKTTKNGFPCYKISGQLGKTFYVKQSILEDIKQDSTEQYYMVSADVLCENIVVGTTNPYTQFNIDGRTNKWLGSSKVYNDSLTKYNDGQWHRLISVFSVNSPRDLITLFNFYFYVRDFTGDIYFKNLKLERVASKDVRQPTPWVESTKDIHNKIDTSIQELSESTTNSISLLENVLRQDLAGKDEVVTLSTYDEFVAKYNLSRDTLSQGLQSASDDLAKILGRTSNIEQLLGEGAADWIFTNINVRMSDEGIVVGNKSSGTYVLISNDKIAFFSGASDEVAYVSSGMLYINQAVFVKSIQIDEFMASSERKGHLTYRYIGS